MNIHGFFFPTDKPEGHHFSELFAAPGESGLASAFVLYYRGHESASNAEETERPLSVIDLSKFKERWRRSMGVSHAQLVCGVWNRLARGLL